MKYAENNAIINLLTPIAKREFQDAEVVCGSNPGEPLAIRVTWKDKKGSETVKTQPMIIKLHEDLLSSEFFERNRSELDVVFSEFIRKKLAQLKPQEGKKAQKWETTQDWIFPDNC